MIVKAVVKRGEKVLSAYMIVSIRFNCWLLLLARLGCSLSAFLLSIVTNGVIASSRYVCTIGAKKKGVKFFFKFFFRWVWVLGCGCSGVGAWVWVRGWGRVGVGVWVWGVWVWGCGSVGGGAGWGWAGAGWGGLDWDCRCRMGANRLPGLTQPGFGLPARV